MTNTSKPSLTITPRCKRDIICVINVKTGLTIQEFQYSTLEEEIQKIAETLNTSNCNEILILLENSPLSNDAWKRIIDKITIGESYFFRDDAQFNFLRHYWIPHLIARKRQNDDKNIRIWSAGCSAGQEIYSIAILLAQQIPDIREWNISLIGTDINWAHLHQAQQAIYSEWSLRDTPEDYRLLYFEQNKPGQYHLKEQYRSSVNFFFLNLADDQFPTLFNSTVSVDLILCRNVFIYFDITTTTQVMEKFSQALNPDGCLLLGSSDLVEQNCAQLELQQWQNTNYWERKVTEQQKHPPIEDVSAYLTDTGNTAIIELTKKKQWGQLVELCTKLETQHDLSLDLLQHKATALANLGKLNQANELCQIILEKDPLNHHIYLLYSLVLLEQNHKIQAEIALRKTISLRRDFFEAYYHLGNLKLLDDEPQEALSLLRHCVKIMEQMPQERRLHNAADLDIKRFSGIVKQEIKIMTDQYNIN